MWALISSLVYTHCTAAGLLRRAPGASAGLSVSLCELDRVSHFPETPRITDVPVPEEGCGNVGATTALRWVHVEGLTWPTGC